MGCGSFQQALCRNPGNRLLQAQLAILLSLAGRTDEADALAANVLRDTADL
jgi:hypothetical protein